MPHLFFKGRLGIFFLITVLILSIGSSLFAQSTFDVAVNTHVLKRNKALEGAVVILLEDGKEIDRVISKGKSDVNFSLALDHDYVVVFSKVQHISKSVEISTKNIPPESMEKNFVPVIEFDVELFEKMEGLDVAILQKAIVKWYYEEKSNEFTYDQEYTASIAKESEKLAKALKEKYEEAYNKYFTASQREYDSKRYEEAKKFCVDALSYKSKSKEANELLIRINKALSKQVNEQDALKDTEYGSYITKADLAFSQADYNEAKASYLAALSIKAFEQYPKDKIQEIDRKLKANQDSEYSSKIKEADKAFRAKDYQSSKSLYRAALKIKPNDDYAKQRIKEIYNLVIALAEGDLNSKNKAKMYKMAIRKGDQAYNDQEYGISKGFYQDALNYKPSKRYPKSRIKLIDEILAKDYNKQKGAYDVFIAEADAAYDKKDYPVAMAAYQSALGVIPGAKYPKKRIRDITSLTSQSEGERYDKIISEADVYFINKVFDKAQKAYLQSLEIKPNEKYPINMLQLINNVLSADKRKELAKSEEAADEISIERRFTIAIANAEKALNSRYYQSAIRYYKEALAIKPGADGIAEKIRKIEGLLATVGAEKTRFSSIENKVARTNAEKDILNQALRKELEAKANAERSRIEKVENAKSLAEGEALKLYLSGLAKKYPQGITNDTIVQNESTIITVIIVDNSRANEYKKTMYNWGGVYYEKNKREIGEVIFKTETRGG